MAKIRTHYDNLRVARNAPDSVIKAAYKALCQTYHPDKFQGSNAEAERIMKLINTSYAVLIHPVKRAEHDAWIREKEAAANQQHEKATFGETGEATEQTYQKQETKWKYTPPPTEPEQSEARHNRNWGIWVFWIATVYFALLALLALVQKPESTPTTNTLPSTVTSVPAQSVSQAVTKKLSCIGDCINGQGTDTYPNGDIYVGEYKDGEPNGQGSYTWASGDIYVGEYKDDEPNGQGTFTWANGDKFVGEFKEGKRNGQGTFTSANGDKYVGEYKDDQANGQGTNTWTNGDKYVGEFKDGNANGQGTDTSANGDKYVGEYKEGKRNGQGTFTMADGTVQNGLWKNSKFVKSTATQDSSPQKQSKKIACEKLLGDGMYNQILEEICNFNGGVRNKIHNMYNKAGCLDIISTTFRDKLAKDILIDTRGRYKAMGHNSFCDSNIDAYNAIKLGVLPEYDTKNSAAQVDIPKFNDYPATTTYNRKNHPLVLDEFSKTFKTRLSNAIKDDKPVFAGHYLVTYWGCGTSCNFGVIIDAITGIAYPFPVTTISSVYPLKSEFENEAGREIIYRLDSNLIIFAGDLDGSDDTIHFYEFKNGEFILLKTLPYGKKAQ